MRKFTYGAVNISEDDGGYTITDVTSPEYERVMEGEQYFEHPGLSLTIEKCADLDAFLDKFDIGRGFFAPVDGFFEHGFEQFQAAYASFDAHWDDILLGKNADWKLIDVYVRNYEFRLTFLNEDLREAYFKEPELISRWGDVYSTFDVANLAPYLRGIELRERCSNQTVFPATRLLIKETNPHSDVPSKTYISFSECCSVRVIEEGNEGGRIISFRNKAYSDDDTPALITEFSW